MVNPKLMCRKHLLGEHVECHMLIGAINKGKKLNGYIEKGLIEIISLQQRHDELVKEMKNRGYNHKSPLPDFDIIYPSGYVNREKSQRELFSRCKECGKK